MAEISKMDSAHTLEMIVFTIAAQEFCVDIMSVWEIRVWTPPTQEDRAPNFVCGVINSRGITIPIIDFAARLGLPPAQPTTRHAILVVQFGPQLFGLLVDGVSEILTISPNLIEPAPEVSSQNTQNLVSGIVAKDNRRICLIAVDAVWPSGEIAA